MEDFLHMYHSIRFVGGWEGLTLPLVEDDPHTGDWKFLSGEVEWGVSFDPPVPIQQVQHNVHGADDIKVLLPGKFADEWINGWLTNEDQD